MVYLVFVVFIDLASIYKKNIYLIIGDFIMVYQYVKVKNITVGVFIFQCVSLSVFSQAQTSIQDQPEKKEFFVGYAYSLVDKTLLYSEHHSISTDKNEQRLSSRVQYKSPEGILIADKTLQYDKQGYFPSFNFVDLRTRHILNVAVDDTMIEITHRKGSSREINVMEAVTDSVMIADAGFDVFMMKNWQALVAGKPKIVEFLAPTRNMFITFKIEQTFLNDSVVGFSLAPENFFISLLVDTIYLEYDLVGGRILSYKGLTNIEEVVKGEASGSNISAHIKYQYSELNNGL
jgi:hypothetical protein